MKTFLFKIRTACSECGEPLILDGPTRSIKCRACQSQLDFDMKDWKRILEFRNDDEVRRRVQSVVLGFASVFTFHVRMGPQSPMCIGCNEPLDISKVEPRTTTGEIHCACGITMPTCPVPSWIGQVDPKAAQLFNVVTEDATHASPVSAQENRPVSFGCPDCGANLKVTMDSPRILECSYCKTDLFLPDPLWRSLHPVKKRTAWYVAFA